jgi:hypothetical protein
MMALECRFVTQGGLEFTEHKVKSAFAALEKLGWAYDGSGICRAWIPPAPAKLRDVPHAKEQLEWLTQPDTVPWYQMPNGTWETIVDPFWNRNNKYLVLPPGEKPPAAKNPLLPETKAPAYGAKYWFAHRASISGFWSWTGSAADNCHLDSGHVYLDERGALADAKRYADFIASQTK